MTPLSQLTRRNYLIAAHDALATAFALLAAFYLRFEGGEAFYARLPLLLRILPLFVVFSVVICYVFSLTTTKWRFISLPDALNIMHFRAPRNVGAMRDPDAVGESEDPGCGDLARFYLRIEGDLVREARFQTYGCGPSIAASSIATELVRDRPLGAVSELTPEVVESALGGLPEERRHAATMVVDALRGALRSYRTGGSRETSHV